MNIIDWLKNSFYIGKCKEIENKYYNEVISNIRNSLRTNIRLCYTQPEKYQSLYFYLLEPRFFDKVAMTENNIERYPYVWLGTIRSALDQSHYFVLNKEYKNLDINWLTDIFETVVDDVQSPKNVLLYLGSKSTKITLSNEKHDIRIYTIRCIRDEDLIGADIEMKERVSNKYLRMEYANKFQDKMGFDTIIHMLSDGEL